MNLSKTKIATLSLTALVIGLLIFRMSPSAKSPTSGVEKGGPSTVSGYSGYYQASSKVGLYHLLYYRRLLYYWWLSLI